MLVNEFFRRNSGHRARGHLETLCMIIASEVHIQTLRVCVSDNPQLSIGDELLASFAFRSSGLGILDLVS